MHAKRGVCVILFLRTWNLHGQSSQHTATICISISASEVPPCQYRLNVLSFGAACTALSACTMAVELASCKNRGMSGPSRGRLFASFFRGCAVQAREGQSYFGHRNSRPSFDCLAAGEPLDNAHGKRSELSNEESGSLRSASDGDRRAPRSKRQPAGA